MGRLVDADDVKDLINGLESLPWEEEVDYLVDSLPTVDAEPVKHGQWMLEVHKETSNYRWNVTAECSECCDEAKEIWGGIFPNVPDCIAKDVSLMSAKSVKLNNFCPNCGAKMTPSDKN